MILPSNLQPTQNPRPSTTFPAKSGLDPLLPRGTLVVFGGFDSYIEEWLPAALFFRDAGYDTILFEGPGQGAALELAHLTMSPEWKKPVKAVLDFFHFDAVTLMGFFLGGGLVIRAAAFEPRVRLDEIGALSAWAVEACQGARSASQEAGGAFLPFAGDLENILRIQEKRAAGNDNCVRYEGCVLQIPGQAHRRHYGRKKDGLDSNPQWSLLGG